MRNKSPPDHKSFTNQPTFNIHSNNDEKRRYASENRKIIKPESAIARSQSVEPKFKIQAKDIEVNKPYYKLYSYKNKAEYQNLPATSVLKTSEVNVDEITKRHRSRDIENASKLKRKVKKPTGTKWNQIIVRAIYCGYIFLAKIWPFCSVSSGFYVLIQRVPRRLALEVSGKPASIEI